MHLFCVGLHWFASVRIGFALFTLVLSFGLVCSGYALVLTWFDLVVFCTCFAHFIYGCRSFAKSCDPSPWCVRDGCPSNRSSHHLPGSSRSGGVSEKRRSSSELATSLANMDLDPTPTLCRRAWPQGHRGWASPHLLGLGRGGVHGHTEDRGGWG